MVRFKLIKVIALGICMSAFLTGTAFAQANIASVPVKGGQTDQALDALYAKQKEIDQYLFTDHADEIKAKGFQVFSTGVTGDYVEIGISPYSKDNADYLYSLFGNDEVKVIETDEPMMYAMGVETAEAGTATAEPGTTVTAKPGTNAADTGTAAASADGSVQIYNPSMAPVAVKAPDAAATPAEGQTSPAQAADTAAGAAIGSGTLAAADSSAASSDLKVAPADGQVYANIANVETVSAQADKADVSGMTAATIDTTGLSTSVIIFIIACGALIIGGAFVIYSRKKTDRAKQQA